MSYIDNANKYERSKLFPLIVKVIPETFHGTKKLNMYVDITNNKKGKKGGTRMATRRIFRLPQKEEKENNGISKKKCMATGHKLPLLASYFPFGSY